MYLLEVESREVGGGVKGGGRGERKRDGQRSKQTIRTDRLITWERRQYLCM